MTEPATITCPVCDAPNAPRSLFCAECGTSLTSSAEDANDTRPSATITDSQSTAVIPSSRSWSDPPASPEPPDPFTRSQVAATGIPTVDSAPYLYAPAAHVESRRGFWLGVVAMILMLIILGMWIWGGVLAADTRNSVSDLFS